jgi:hypothetical protein
MREAGDWRRTDEGLKAGMRGRREMSRGSEDPNSPSDFAVDE